MQQKLLLTDEAVKMESRKRKQAEAVCARLVQFELGQEQQETRETSGNISVAHQSEIEVNIHYVLY